MNMEKICEDEIVQWMKTGNCNDMQSFVIQEDQRSKNEENISSFMENIKSYMNSFPKQKRMQKKWQKKGEAFLQEWIQQSDFSIMAEMQEEDSKCFYEISKQFMKDARSFDCELSLEDIGQALRNIWIIIILQRIFGKQVIYHKAMFAYSMLYPYSDNYLDDIQIPKEEKEQFNQWFSNRLMGNRVSIKNSHEEKISNLVSMIEAVFDRNEYPAVYESLMQIQDAQILSLNQQDGEDILSQKQLTYISFRKGGTSVVADGFLIDGKISEEQQSFCMRYGFMLQIGDDLQDGVHDQKHFHQTLVSTNLDQHLDPILYKLMQYTHDILQPQAICEDQPLLNFVLHDCVLLLCLAVIQNPELYSSACYEEMLSCIPIGLEKMEELQHNNSIELSKEEILERLDALLET